MFLNADRLAILVPIVYSPLSMYQTNVIDRRHTAEAANAALVAGRSGSFDPKLRTGVVLALAGRCAR